MSWAWLLVSILCEVAATLSLRASDGLRGRLWLIPVATGYTAALIFLGLSLAAGMPVGVAYGLWTAIGIVVIAVAARAIWGDPLTGRMLAGIALIIAGVFLIEIELG